MNQSVYWEISQFGSGYTLDEFVSSADGEPASDCPMAPDDWISAAHASSTHIAPIDSSSEFSFDIPGTPGPLDYFPATNQHYTALVNDYICDQDSLNRAVDLSRDLAPYTCQMCVPKEWSEALALAYSNALSFMSALSVFCFLLFPFCRRKLVLSNDLDLPLVQNE